MTKPLVTNEEAMLYIWLPFTRSWVTLTDSRENRYLTLWKTVPERLAHQYLTLEKPFLGDSWPILGSNLPIRGMANLQINHNSSRMVQMWSNCIWYLSGLQTRFVISIQYTAFHPHYLRGPRIPIISMFPNCSSDNLFHMEAFQSRSLCTPGHNRTSLSERHWYPLLYSMTWWCWYSFPCRSLPDLN